MDNIDTFRMRPVCQFPRAPCSHRLSCDYANSNTRYTLTHIRRQTSRPTSRNLRAPKLLAEFNPATFGNTIPSTAPPPRPIFGGRAPSGNLREYIGAGRITSGGSLASATCGSHSEKWLHPRKVIPFRRRFTCFKLEHYGPLRRPMKIRQTSGGSLASSVKHNDR